MLKLIKVLKHRSFNKYFKILDPFLQPKKLDKAFLAELEKDIYKNEANILKNTKHYEKASYKNYDFAPSSSIEHIPLPGIPMQAIPPILNNNLSNFNNSNNLAGIQQNIETINQQIIQRNNYAIQEQQQYAALPSNIYDSIAGDIYGSINGNVYDVVQGTPAGNLSNYGSTGAIYMQQSQIQQIQLNQSMQQIQQQAIYDEVAAYEELMRPTRPAPSLPTASLNNSTQFPALPPTPLSHQQIQRRVERLSQQQTRIGALMSDLLTDNVSEFEARESLEACNWDHSAAAKHFKVERLFK